MNVIKENQRATKLMKKDIHNLYLINAEFENK